MSTKRLRLMLFQIGFLGLTLLSSCVSIDCPLNSTVAGTFNFYKNGAPATIADTVNIYLRVNGKDSLVVNKLYNSKTVDLSFSYYQATDTLIFKINMANRRKFQDTVYISKENIPHFNSPECGTWMEHVVTKCQYTRNDFDSIVLANPKIDTYEAENFRIYFK